MPFDTMERIQAGLAASNIAMELAPKVDAVLAIPAAERTAVVWCGMLGVGGVGLSIAQAVDVVNKGAGVTIDVVANALGIEPAGSLGHVIAFIQKLIEDIKD